MYQKPWIELGASYRMATLHRQRWRSDSKPGLNPAQHSSACPPTCPPQLSQYLWLLVVLHGHGDDVEADDAGDEQIQVVAGAHLVNQEAETGVIRVVGLTLSFCSGEEESERQIKGFLCVFLKSTHPHSTTPEMINSRPITATCCLFYFLFFLLECYHF